MYVGDKKIKNQQETDGRVRVTFEDDSTVTLTQKMFNASVSAEPLDATKLQERRVVAVQVEFMQLLLDWDMKLSDTPALLQWSANYLDQKHEFASEKLWGNKYKDRTIGDLEGILSAKNSGRDNNAVASEGSGVAGGFKG